MQCFTVANEEIKGKRIDPYYYSPSNICNIAKQTTFEVLELAQIAKLQRGKFSHRPRNDPRFFNGLHPFIQTGDIVKASQNDLQISYSQTLNDLGLSVSKLFSEKTILITIAANIGDTAILDYPACFPDSVVAITPKKEVIKLEYLNIYLKFLKNYLNNLAPQAAQKNINLEQLSPTPIVIPPITIQEQIISIMEKAHNSKKVMEEEAKKLLSRIDDYVLSELGIKIPKIEEKKVFIVTSNEVENERINPQYHQPVFVKIIHSIKSGHFEVGNLGNLIKTIHYGASIQSDYQSEGISFLRITNISPNKIDLSNVVKINSDLRKDLGNAFVKEGDFLISRSGSVGIVTLVPKEADGFAFGSFMIRFVIEHNEVNKDFISMWLNNKAMQLLIERDKIGAIQGNITIDSIKNFIIPLPPLEIQNKIASEVKTRMQKAKKLKEEAKSILQKAKDEVEKMILGGVNGSQI